MSSRDRYFKIAGTPGGYSYLKRVKHTNGSGELIAIGSDRCDEVHLTQENTPVVSDGANAYFYLNHTIDGFQVVERILKAIGAKDTRKRVQIGDDWLKQYVVNLSALGPASFREVRDEVISPELVTRPFVAPRLEEASYGIDYQEVPFSFAKRLRRKFEWIKRAVGPEAVGEYHRRIGKSAFESADYLVYSTPTTPGFWHAMWLEDDGYKSTYIRGYSKSSGFPTKQVLVEHLESLVNAQR
jgi:hypothetical protein